MLLDPFTQRGLTLRNRIVVSPMCQYSSDDGFATDWHLVHLGSRAVGGAGLVFTEATAVTADGRISPEDLGIWKDEHLSQLWRIVRFINEQGAPAGIQLAHAGRKGSTYAPWRGHGAVAEDAGGWPVMGPSAIPFSPSYPAVSAMSTDDIAGVVEAFVTAAERATSIGFGVIELHAAHGYLLHQFLSPLSNQRTDRYGGSLENRMRFVLDCVRALRHALPDATPLWVRISATEWAPGGWDIEDAVTLCQRLRDEGVDLIDVSSGGNVAGARIPVGPGYQVPFAARIRRDAGVATGAVGLITDVAQAEEIISRGSADVVLLARELLRDPYWPMRAGARPVPDQYLRAY